LRFDTTRENNWDAHRQAKRSVAASDLDICEVRSCSAGTAWFQGSIEVRNPYIDPLNLMQIELLNGDVRYWADASVEEQSRLRELLRLTVQGIAAGIADKRDSVARDGQASRGR